MVSSQDVTQVKSEIDIKNHYEILGSEFISKQQSHPLPPPGHPFIGVLFTAHWCPPCKIFLPKLIDFYTDLQIEEKPFEIVLVPMDKDPSAYNEHWSEMPWLSVPLDQTRCAMIRDKFNIIGIPTLVIIDTEGRIITNKGRDHVMTHGSSAYEVWQKREVEVKEAEAKTALWYKNFEERKRQEEAPPATEEA